MAMATLSSPSLHQITDLAHATTEDLELLIHTFPVIDNHAHNMLLDDLAYGSSDYPFETITSEAQGPALFDHVHSTLSHMRAIRQLAHFFDCRATLADVKAARHEWVRRDYQGLIKKCFEGTHAIMMDDGLSADAVHPYQWHRQFVPQVSRIVRIEAVAAEILEQLVLAAGLIKPGLDADWEKNQTEAFFIRFNGEFRNQIRAFANDADVRGFKSVICYRTGLDVELTSRKALRPQQSLTESNLLSSFHDFLQKAVRNNDYRIERKEVNDYLVVAVCDVLDKRVEAEGEGLPFQFHTGLGDPDINLVKANPAYLQPLIEAFPNVDFVLLHSSYPYTREAGYLASAYSNAWLDIGEVFPMLSREGEETVLREALELTPTSKILWSTDGHFYPETYWLANNQFRDVLRRVLTGGVARGDYDVRQAVTIATDIMFWNSNSLYKLKEETKYPHLWHACGRSTPNGSFKTLVNRNSSENASLNSMAPKAPKAAASALGPSAISQPESSSNADIVRSTIEQSENLAVFDAFLEKNPSVKYIWLEFLDYTATLRVRMVTIRQFRKQLTTGVNPGITKGLLRIMQDDSIAPGGTATGEMILAPDLSTLTLNKGIPSPSATVQNWWMEEGSNRSDHLEGCPRWTLEKQTHALKSEFGITMLMGFEVEIVFMRPVLDDATSTYTEFLPLHTVHSWSTMTYQQLGLLPMIEEIVDTLAELDIHLPQYHAEAAPGQWEFPLPCFEPLKSVDSLYKVRSVIQNIAKNHGLKATLYPRPYNFSCGSASHSHFSINGPGDTVSKYADPFLAGLLEHLPAILAFTLPLEESYQRVMAGIWAGGAYVTWGTQNRETPLRLCGPGHWEMKTVDGIGNMYLSMAAVLAAGLYGLQKDLKLEHKDCTSDSSQMSEEERAAIGITTKLPTTRTTSLMAVEKDEVLKKAMGEEFVGNYIALKKAEMEKLIGFGDKKRRLWLMERY